MFKKNISALFVLFSAIFIFGSAARAQETEAAASSGLTGVSLPAGAQRVLPNSVFIVGLSFVSLMTLAVLQYKKLQTKAKFTALTPITNLK